MSGARLFLSSFEVLYVDISLYKRVWTPVLDEQLSTMLRMRIAAIYHLFIKRRLKIIQVTVWRYI